MTTVDHAVEAARPILELAWLYACLTALIAIDGVLAWVVGLV